MKHLIKKTGISVIALVIIFSINFCSKDDSTELIKLDYDKIEFEDIKEYDSSEFSKDLLIIVEDNIHLIGVNSVIFYKTANGNYGKLQIKDITDSSKFRLGMIATTYNDSGEAISTIDIGNKVIINEGFHCELEPLIKQVVLTSKGGFQWKLKSGGIDLLPVNDTSFAVYSEN